MLKSENLKKLLVIMLAVILLVLIQAPVQATSPIISNNSAGTSNGVQNIPTLNQTNNTANVSNNATTNVPSVNGVTNTTNKTNTSSYSNTSSLPKAGVDYSVLFVIVACVASGIYAYVKIRDYNNIKY